MLALLALLFATVFNTTTSSIYSCDGVQTAYTVGFPYGASGDLIATSTTAGGGVTSLNLTTDYTLSVISTQSTAVLTLTAGSKCPSGSTLKILRSTALTQPTNLRTQGQYQPATHEAAWDRMMRQMQEVKAGVSGNPSVLVTPTGATKARSLPDLFADYPNGASYGIVCDGVTDNTANFQNAVNSVAPGTLYLPKGTCITGQILLPTKIRIAGAGMFDTIIKTKASTNAPMFINGSTSTYGVVIQDLYMDGNDANNTVGGCLFWNPTVATDGPGIALINVYVTHCQAGAANVEAILIWGIDWAYFSNVRITQNRNARGLYIKASDGLYSGLYMSSNGGNAGYDGMIVQQGAANHFVGAYFGGGDGAANVRLLGAQYTEFVMCINDSAWTHGYQFSDSGGIGASFNQIIGGVVNSPSQAAGNVSDHIVFEGQATGNRILGTGFDNLKTSKGRYALTELNTATGNACQSCRFGTFGTGVNNARPGATRIVESPGYNPLGPATITVTASPFTYTNNDNVPENIYMYGGTVSGVTKSGITIFNSSPNDAWLEPGESMIVTYTVVPTMIKDRK